MRYVFRLICKSIKIFLRRLFSKISWVVSWFIFYLNGVDFFCDYIANGIPIVNVSLQGKFNIGRNFEFNSGRFFNTIGRQQRCIFIVGKNANLNIGNNVGVSSVAIVCHQEVVIGDNVRLGGNVVIYDTDFHSLNQGERTMRPEITSNIKMAAVFIEKGAFIGAHSLILKGTTIGENSIVGAGSVVSKNIPANQIWAGNPIKFIKNI